MAKQRLMDAVRSGDRLSAPLRNASDAEYGELMMKEQNAPLWRNGQIPSSNEGSSQNDAERQAQQQNQKSEQNKRKH